MLLAALDAALVAGIGIAIPLAPLTVLWAVQYGFGPDWLIFWRASVDSWLVGHGVDLMLVFDPAIAAALGVPPDQTTVWVTMAVLGFALLTLLLGVRAGGRIADTGHPVLGAVTAAAVFGTISTLATLSALHELARPSIVQGAILPTAVLTAGMLLGMLRALPDHEGLGHPLRRAALRLPQPVRAVASTGLRAGTAAAALVLLAACVTVGVLILLDYAALIRLYEGLHGGYAGGAALTVGQLALLPNLVIWACAWFIGPGFAIGTGSSVSPLGTTLGPLPAVPVLGALPTDELAYGFLGLLVPVVAGFLAGVATSRGLRRALGDDASPGWAVAAAPASGLVGGTLLGLLAWASAGSAGPGRLHDVGPDPLLVGLIAAAELTLAVGIGLAAGRVGVPGLPTRRRTEPTETDAPRRERTDADDVDTAQIPVVAGRR